MSIAPKNDANAVDVGGVGVSSLLPLPKLYSTIDEVEDHLRLRPLPGSHGRRIPPSPSPSPSPSTKTDRDDDDRPAPPIRTTTTTTTNNDAEEKKKTTTIAPPALSIMPHLFLHFDVNETILIGDPAGGDTAEECLNKIIAKSAFVSTVVAEGDVGDDVGDDGDGNADADADAGKSNDDASSARKRYSETPTRWWNGLPLLPPANGDRENDNENENENKNDDPPIPPPLYTGWEWPSHTRPYYRTEYKKFAKRFTETSHGRIYRPLYEDLRSKITKIEIETKTGGCGPDDDDDDKKDAFENYLPAFFRALEHYFPSTAITPSTPTPTAASSSSSSQSRVDDDDGDASQLLPPPPSKVTLVFRTFGTDLPAVAEVVSEFARGNHPSHPDYYNADLILEGRDLLRAAWVHSPPARCDDDDEAADADDGDDDGDGSDNRRKEWIYELRRAEEEENDDDVVVVASGDDEVLNYLQSRTVVGIRDCYPHWRDHDYAPWSGKPVWARTTTTRHRVENGECDGRRPYPHHRHHHVLLDDNIHNDPDDGAGGIRVPVTSEEKATTTSTDGNSSYESLRGEEALELHGKHLIRVPTVRPLLEEDWFVRQIQEARRRAFLEDIGGGGGSEKKASGDSVVLSNRNLSEDDFRPDDARLPRDARSIDLSRNRLTRIPDRVFSCTTLTSLDVSRNALRGFPPQIGRLTNLVTLIALSNHLRLRQMSLDDLASIGRLRLLDLRYNRKLKRSALDVLEDALLPNNPRLEIRCTVPPSPEEETSHGGAKRKHASACDRDATLLRSQLEPLSTPQLRKRLERSFGDALSLDGENDERAYDREFVMGTLLRRYEERGIPPRRVRYERGVPVSPRRLAALRAELEATSWPNTTRERPKVRAERYMILQRPGSGKADSARTKKETAKLARYRRLFDLAVEAIAEADEAFAGAFTALAVTKNFVGSPHIDTLNVGPFYGMSLGEFTGGGAIAVECSPFLVAEVDTRGRLGKVDGRFPHWVTPYEGTRYSLIYYVTSGSVEPQTTAIFPPPKSSNPSGKLDPWIPPPTYVP